jgi:hypothetical protein
LAEIRFIAHRLAGSAGTFGWGWLCEPAGALDELVAGGSREPDAIRKCLGRLVAEIDAVT